MTLPPREQLDENGFVSEAFELADPDVITALGADVDVFDNAIDALARAGHKRVPYIVTEAIAKTANDANIVRLVEAALGTDAWVMWGSNIRTGTPNQAHRWHVDLESFLWPSLTIAVGLQGCSPEAATRFIPGSQRLGVGPASSANDADTAAVLRKAVSLDARCRSPERVGGFGDGRFYAFNARCWHCGDPATSSGRVILFLHYQRADARRVPYMLDYDRHRWSREAAPYIVSPGCRQPETRVYRPPLRHLAGNLLRKLRRRSV